MNHIIRISSTLVAALAGVGTLACAPESSLPSTAQLRDSAATSSTAIPEPEPVVTVEVPVPPGVEGVNNPRFHPDGEHIVFGFENQSGKQVGIIAQDGSDFRCLSCALGSVLSTRIDVPNDGKRVLIGNGTTIGNFQGSPYPSPFPGDGAVPLLECAPSLLDCQEVELVFARIPYDEKDPRVLVPHRESRIAPDGVHLAWQQVRSDIGSAMIMGELRRVGDHYELDELEVLTNTGPWIEPIGDDEFALVEPLTAGELKSFQRGGASVVFVGPSEGSNFDAFEIDLASGLVTRRTEHPDYDEPLDLSPDESWAVVGSKRSFDPAADLLAPFNLIPRPPFFALGGGVNLLGLWAFQGDDQANRGLDAWLIDAEGERDGYIGQPLSTDLCYGAFTRKQWRPDGTGVLALERKRPRAPAECDGLPPRMVIYELTDREPIPPEQRTPPVPSPDAPWAAADPETLDPVAPPTGKRSFPGPGGGVATVVWLPIPAPALLGSSRVDYDGYIDAEGRRLDGFEAIHYASIGTMRYVADIQVSGSSEGFLSADASWTGLSSFRGELVGEVISELDGEQRRICGPVDSAACPPEGDSGE